MIFTSSSVTSFQNHRLREKSIQNASLAADICRVRMLTFPLCVSPFLLRGARLGAGEEAPHQHPSRGWILCWMFINYLCLQAECTIVLSETLTFSISLRFGASYKVHCEKGVLTLRMIWRTEIPLSFIIYPGWPRGKQAVALSYLTG